MDAIVEGGFVDPVLEGQGAFRAIMDALARPGLAQPFSAAAIPPAPLPRGLATVALTLCDHDTPVWLDAVLAGSGVVADWLRFHTGAPIVAAPADAQFALVTAADQLPALADFAQGSDEYPDRSTTVVLAPGRKLSLRLEGPGIRGHLDVALGLGDAGFLPHWAVNRAHFPRGVDVILAGDGEVVGLPRTTRLMEV